MHPREHSRNLPETGAASSIQDQIRALSADMAPQPDADGKLIPSLEEWFGKLGSAASDWLAADQSNLEIVRIIYRNGIYNRPRPAADPIEDTLRQYEQLVSEQQKNYQLFREGKIENLEDQGNGFFYERDTKLLYSNDIFERNIAKFSGIKNKIEELKTLLAQEQ